MSKIKELFERGQGVFHLAPCWVPRGFNEPGHRLRLHPDDYFALGMDRGGICERWLGSTAKALNGPKTGEFEGMSFVYDEETGEKILFLDCVNELGAELIGDTLQDKYQGWPAFSKLYDYDKPLFHHLHLTEEMANKIGMHGKPEAYFFPVQYNQSYQGRFPLTYFGFDPSTTKEQVMECLRDYENRDTRITELSRAYRIKLGTGWYTEAGVVHAPASLVTFEPQWNSDVNTILENVTMGEVNSVDLLTGSQPEGEKGSIEQLMSQINWEECTRRDYKEKYYREPKLVEKKAEGLTEKWIAYANDWVAAKEVTVAPGASVLLKDSACYMGLVVQGYGSFGSFECKAPEMVRFHDMTSDEFFVSEKAAAEGILVENRSKYEPLVILQQFANNNPEVPQTV